MQTKNITTITKPQAPRTIINMQWVVEPVLTEAKRDSDGRFLKRHVKLAAAPKAQSAANVAMASAFGVDASELFA